MGVRYNAEKKKVGNYYSTPIYSFRCKCHLCDGWFEIETDPKVPSFGGGQRRVRLTCLLTFVPIEYAIRRYFRGPEAGTRLGS